MDDNFYTLYEEGGRLAHCGMLTDKEFNEFDKSNTFTTAIILFNNNEKMLDYLKKTYEYIKKRGPKKFDYSKIKIEINNELTPEVWGKKLL